MRPARMLPILMTAFACWLGFAPIEAVNAQTPKTTSQPALVPQVPGRFVDITEKSGVHFLHQAPHTFHRYPIGNKVL